MVGMAATIVGAIKVILDVGGMAAITNSRKMRSAQKPIHNTESY